MDLRTSSAPFIRLLHVSSSARIRSLITRFWKTVHTRYSYYRFHDVRGLRENSLVKATDRFHLKQMSNKTPLSDLIPHVHETMSKARKAAIDLRHLFRYNSVVLEIARISRFFNFDLSTF